MARGLKYLFGSRCLSTSIAGVLSMGVRRSPSPFDVAYWIIVIPNSHLLNQMWVLAQREKVHSWQCGGNCLYLFPENEIVATIPISSKVCSLPSLRFYWPPPDSYGGGYAPTSSRS